MMESIIRTRRMVLECSPGPVATDIKVITRMMKERELEKCDGQMEVFTKVNGSEEFNMEKDK